MPIADVHISFADEETICSRITPHLVEMSKYLVWNERKSELNGCNHFHNEEHFAAYPSIFEQMQIVSYWLRNDILYRKEKTRYILY